MAIGSSLFVRSLTDTAELLVIVGSFVLVRVEGARTSDVRKSEKAMAVRSSMSKVSDGS